MSVPDEILLARGEINRVVAIDVEIYDARLTTYHADGFIVATATGSTAYALAAGTCCLTSKKSTPSRTSIEGCASILSKIAV